MKRIVALLALILAPALSFAQTNVIQNEAGTSYAPNAGNINSNVAVDRALRLIVSLSSGTASATNPIKLEDSAHTSGDAGISTLFVRNSAFAAMTNADGDYSNAIVSDTGVLAVGMTEWGGTTPQARLGAVRAEDTALTTGDRVVVVGSQREDALTLNTDASGDVTTVKADALGRTITTLSPAGETWQACTGTITDTTQTAIKAAVASNRIYVTSIGCNNSSAVASTLVFQDASTAIWQGAITAVATNGSYTMTFPVPLRGTVNTALNVTLGTTATNTRCCAAGYISVN